MRIYKKTDKGAGFENFVHQKKRQKEEVLRKLKNGVEAKIVDWVMLIGIGPFVQKNDNEYW